MRKQTLSPSQETPTTGKSTGKSPGGGAGHWHCLIPLSAHLRETEDCPSDTVSPNLQKRKPNSERTGQNTLTRETGELQFEPNFQRNMGLVRAGTRDFRWRNPGLGSALLRSWRRLSQLSGPKELELPQGDYFLGQDPGKPSIPIWVQTQESIKLLQLEWDLKVACSGLWPVIRQPLTSSTPSLGG